MWIGHATQGSAPFQVDNDGSVLCSDLQVTGGSVNIGSNNNVLIITTAGAISSGLEGGGITSPFHVTAAGVMYATGAVITGDIESGSTITGTEIEGGTISISSGKFHVDEYGNLIAKSISLGDAAAPTSYSNSMIMGGGSLHKIRISSSAFGLYSDTTALEWYDSNLSTRRGYLTGGQLGAVGANVDLGVQLGGDDNKQNYIAAYQESVTGDGIMITAHKTSYNDITISAGGFIDLDAAEGIEIAQKSSAPSSASGKLYNHNGTLKWGTTSLTGGGGGAVDSIVAGDNIQVSGATGDVTVTFDGNNVSLVDGTITAGTIQTASSGSRLKLSPTNALPDVVVDTGTAQAGANTTITLKSGSSGTNDYYNDLTITLTGGPGNGDVRIISDYDGSSKVATVSAAWTTNPTSSTTYSITRKTNTFLSGYTGKTTEDYPGFIYYYGERDSVTHSRQWGRVAFSSPRFSAAIAYTGFVFSHSDDGWGELTFGLPNHADQFVIADAGSGSTPTNTFNRGGITIVDDTPAATGNTLYSLDVGGTPTLYWNGSAIGGGTTYTFSSPLSESSGTVSIDLSAYMTHWKVQGDDASPTEIGPTQETLVISGGTHLTSARASNQITINHNSGAGSNHIPAGGSTNQFLKYSSSGTATWAAAPADATKLPLTGGTLTGALTVDADLTLTGYRNVSATNSLYLRSNTSTTNITCYGGGATQLHSGGNAILNAGNSYVTIYKSIKPSPSYAPNPPSGLTCGVASSGVFLNMYSQSYSGSSDENLKTDIEDATYGLDFVKGLRPRTFKWAQTVDGFGEGV